jgi:predicted TIM-barrel enzyme
MPHFLKQLRELGICGVQNFPTVGLIDAESAFRKNLEETGMGFDREVEMIRIAHQMGLLTTPYAFNVTEAKAMAEAGADVIVAHMGLTSSGSIGASTTKSLDDCIKLIQDIRDASVAINPDILILCHGGPIAMPEDAKHVLENTKGVHGFYGASSMERLPVEKSIVENAKQFKGLQIHV